MTTAIRDATTVKNRPRLESKSSPLPSSDRVIDIPRRSTSRRPGKGYPREVEEASRHSIGLSETYYPLSEAEGAKAARIGCVKIRGYRLREG